MKRFGGFFAAALTGLVAAELQVAGLDGASAAARAAADQARAALLDAIAALVL